MKSYILVGVAGVLALSSVFMTIETATSGIEVRKLEETESVLTAQKSELESRIAQTRSLAELQGQSGALGFVKPTDTVYITLDEPVAKLP